MADMIHLVSSFPAGEPVASLSPNRDQGAKVRSTAGQALCMIGPASNILSATPPFQELVDDAIHVFNDRMRAARREEDAALQALVSALISVKVYEDAPVRIARLTRKDGTPLVAHGISIMGGNSLPGGAPVAIVVFDVPVTRVTGESMLCQVYGLTVAEARLASRLALGMSLKEAAAAEGITYETARGRLKVVFRKTDTARQAQLVLLLSRLR